MGLQMFTNHFAGLSIPPDGTLYFTLESPAFAAGAITVTAHPQEGVSGVVPDYAEIVQMAVRREDDGAQGLHFILDLVLRNNGHAGQAAGYIKEIVVYTAVMT